MLLAQAQQATGGGGIPWQVILPAVVAVVAAALSYLAARRSDKSNTSTKTIELGVTELVNQLRTERGHLEEELEECKKECKDKVTAFEARVAQLEQVVANQAQEVIEKDTIISDQEGELIRLRLKAGEV